MTDAQTAARRAAIDEVTAALEAADHQGAAAAEVAHWAVDALLARPDLLRALTFWAEVVREEPTETTRTTSPPVTADIARAITAALDVAELTVRVYRSGVEQAGGDYPVQVLARCLDQAGLIDWAGVAEDDG